MPEGRKFLQDERPDTTQQGRMSDFEFWACIVILGVFIFGAITVAIINKIQEDDAVACIERGQC